MAVSGRRRSCAVALWGWPWVCRWMGGGFHRCLWFWWRYESLTPGRRIISHPLISFTKWLVLCDVRVLHSDIQAAAGHPRVITTLAHTRTHAHTLPPPPMECYRHSSSVAGDSTVKGCQRDIGRLLKENNGGRQWGGNTRELANRLLVKRTFLRLARIRPTKEEDLIINK